MLVCMGIGDYSDKLVHLGLWDWEGQKTSCDESHGTQKKVHAGDKVVEGYLFHLNMCRNVVCMGYQWLVVNVSMTHGQL